MMAGSLRAFYFRRYHAAEGVEWLRRFVTADATPGRARARALQGLALFSDANEDYALWDETIEMYRQLGSKRELVGAFNNAGISALVRYELETARERFEEGVRLARELDDPALLASILDSYAHLVHAADNDLATALALHEEALVCARQIGSPEQIAEVLTMLGYKRRLAGDLNGAAVALHEAQKLEKDLGTKHGNAGWTQMGLANIALDQDDIPAAVAQLLDFNEVMRPLAEDERDAWNAVAKPLFEWGRIAAARGDHDVAVTLFAAQAADIAKPKTWPGSREWHIEVEEAVNASMNQLDPDRFEAAWNDGLQMTSSEALDYAVTSFPQEPR
jgi:tetratricopeptide (TPR) repeat protein